MRSWLYLECPRFLGPAADFRPQSHLPLRYVSLSNKPKPLTRGSHRPPGFCIKSVRFPDPACGCGNFLVVSYRELRQLDLEILKRLEDLDPSAGGTLFFERENLNVRLENFAGIEMKVYARFETAITW